LEKKKLEEKHQRGTVEYSKRERIIDKLAEANIPVAYWYIKMKDFNGPENIKEATLNYIKNIDENYNSGQGLCFTGNYGIGKTVSSCMIMKNALIRGYESYYTTLLDLISYLADFSTKRDFYHLVTRVDFLCIDEVDSRHFSDSEDAQRMFGSSFERVIRYRNQNKLPTVIVSNNTSIMEVFVGQHKRAIDSLLSSVKMISAIGKDYRKK